jgi:hypothetical protein
MMDAETKERYEGMENGLALTQALLHTAVQSQRGLQDLFADTQKSIGLYVDAANIRMKQMEANRGAQADAQLEMQKSISSYVEAANACMKQMEANLDALIRLITSEHSNGHNKL